MDCVATPARFEIPATRLERFQFLQAISDCGLHNFGIYLAANVLRERDNE
jgi:hypothetical protein